MKAFIGPILVLLVLGSLFGNIAYKDYKDNQPKFTADQCLKEVEYEGNEFQPPTYGYLKVLEVGKEVYKLEVYYRDRLSDSHFGSFISTRHFGMLNKRAVVIECSEILTVFN